MNIYHMHVDCKAEPEGAERERSGEPPVRRTLPTDRSGLSPAGPTSACRRKHQRTSESIPHGPMDSIHRAPRVNTL